MNPLDLSPVQLRMAAGIKDQINDLTTELNNILAGAVGPRGRKRHGMSAAGRARIAAAAKARWAKFRGSKRTATPAPPSRKFSAAARKRLALAAKARWAKVKAAGKNQL
jgi:hypothetical protein